MVLVKKIKGLLLKQDLRTLLAITLLAAVMSEVSAETKIIEVPYWSIKNDVDNPLSKGNLNVEQSKIGILVPSAIVVKGNLSSDIGEKKHLWIAVKPYKSIENWWPQTGGPLPLINESDFEGNAFLGGTCGDQFEIGILIVGDEINNKFSDWINYSRSTNKWPPITEGSPGRDNKVSKQEIEAKKYASIIVTLIE